MSATVTPTRRPALAPVSLPARRGREVLSRIDRRLVWPTVASAVNALLFFLLRPGVNDLWAARARAYAVEHGVGLTYWFGWFGGATPGNYSVLSPWVCAVAGTELVGALSAVAIIPLTSVALRGTARPVAASWVAVVCVALNVWSGRVPFLFGTVFAILAIIALRSERRALTIALTVVTVLVSPVSGAFIALGLVGTFLATRTRSWRPIIAWTAAAAGIVLIALAVVFGAPGAEPFNLALGAGSLGAALVLLFAEPPDHVRITIWVAEFVTLAVLLVPNGLGANVGRFVWFCLPVVVAATARIPLKWVVCALVPAIGIGAGSTIIDLMNAVQPESTQSYYRSLAHRLDQTPGLRDYRLEVVDQGAHAGYDALLGHANLARGWETQEDHTLNRVLDDGPLSATTYKVWLDDNAVGYVALPTGSVSASVAGGYPEYSLVRAHRPHYLLPVWSNADWELFRVAQPTRIVAAPAEVLSHSQSAMTVRIPCRCTISLRLRWSKFLTARLQQPIAGPRRWADTSPAVTARVRDDGYGWSRLHVSRPGVYSLRGSFGTALLTHLDH